MVISKTIGWLLFAGSIMVLIPYTILVISFEYPDILRNDTGIILTKFHEGGSTLVFTWLAFGLVGFPLIVACIKLGQQLEKQHGGIRWATVIGTAGLAAQMIALLRWVFVVPVLANDYVTGNEVVKAASAQSFKVVHQFGGVLLGECIGQLFTIIWTYALCIAFLKQKILPKWLHWFGLISSAIYFTAQTELVATVVPGFPVIPYAGLTGSSLWLIWLILLGVQLIKRRRGENISINFKN